MKGQKLPSKERDFIGEKVEVKTFLKEKNWFTLPKSLTILR
jgi:hypothetical protein